MLIVNVFYFTYLKPNISRKVFNMLTRRQRQLEEAGRQQQLEEVGRQRISEMSLEQESVQDNEGSREVVGAREQEVGEIGCNNVENIVDEMGEGSQNGEMDGLTAK